MRIEGNYVWCLVIVTFIGLGRAKRWGGGWFLSHHMEGGKPQRGEPIFMVGVDPSKDHGNGLNIYIGYLMVYP